MKKEVKITVKVTCDINHALSSVFDALLNADNVTQRELDMVYGILHRVRYEMLSKKAKQAVLNYGTNQCIEAFECHERGNGASSIGTMLGVTTRQADAIINAGREILSL